MSNGFNYSTGQYDGSPDVDLSGTVSDPSMVLGDVSNGAPDMSPSTPTGNGSGYSILPAALPGMLAQGLNYAIQKDQQGTAYSQMSQAAAINTAQLQALQKKNGKLFLLIGAAVLLVVFTAEEKK